jgi:hypothetical protein
VVVGTIEVGKVGIYLEDPVGLDKYNSADIYIIISLRKKGLVLYPGDDVMQVPRDNEENRSRGKIPSPSRRVKEGKKAIWYGQKELR